MDEFEIYCLVHFDENGKLPAGWPDISRSQVKVFEKDCEVRFEHNASIPDWPFSELHDYAKENGLFDQPVPAEFIEADQVVDWFGTLDNELELIRTYFID